MAKAKVKLDMPGDVRRHMEDILAQRLDAAQFTAAAGRIQDWLTAAVRILTPRAAECLHFDEWLRDNWLPEGATHATIDRQGGCCWWAGEPKLAVSEELGWKGDLVERYYDPAMPMGGMPWSLSLRELTPSAEGGEAGSDECD